MSLYPRVNLRRLATLGTGHTPSRHHPEYWEDCTIPWLTLADVWQLRDGTKSVVTETEEKISETGVANSSARVHPAGTVAMSRTASVGFTCLLGADMATSQDFVTWTCGPHLHPRFLLHSLRGQHDEILSMRMGSTHQTIYMPDVERIRTPLPSLEEQRKIVNFLDAETVRIDSLIAKKRRLIEALDEMQMSVMTDGVQGIRRRCKPRSRPSAAVWRVITANIASPRWCNPIAHLARFRGTSNGCGTGEASAARRQPTASLILRCISGGSHAVEGAGSRPRPGREISRSARIGSIASRPQHGRPAGPRRSG